MATNYKTVLCKYWQQTGTCKYNENCSFAHGDPEMRTAIENASLLAGQQVPYNQHWDPMKDPQIEFAVRLHQLALISEQLQEYHANDQETLIDIQGANDLLCKGNINSASYQLQKIIYRKTEDQEEIEKHHAIFAEAESFAARCLEEMNNRNFPEILRQKPKNLEFPEEAMKDEPIPQMGNQGMIQNPHHGHHGQPHHMRGGSNYYNGGHGHNHRHGYGHRMGGAMMRSY